jgi:hypothetical protein
MKTTPVEIPQSRRLPRRAFHSLLLIALAAAGCTSGHQVHPVSPDQAKQTLVTVLNGWKEGKQPDAWRSQMPEIVVQDVDWSMGKKLVGYEIVSDKAIDSNLHCEVKLTIEEGGEQKTQTVTYLVGTSPVLTVFRKILP